jgi:hypothetical protein
MSEYKDSTIERWTGMTTGEWDELAPNGAEAIVMVNFGSYRWIKFDGGVTLISHGAGETSWHRWKMTRERIEQDYKGLIAYRPTTNEEPEPIPTPCQDAKTSHRGAEAAHDPINNPKHYSLYPETEAIDVIQAVLTADEFAGYCKGNSLKYRLRAGKKDAMEQDVGKAGWYERKLWEVVG